MDSQRAYVAGVGMVTAIGANAEMTAAAVKAGISGYTISGYFTPDEQPITMACVPDDVFTSMDIEIEEGDHYSEQYDHIIKMAIIAVQEAFFRLPIKKTVPLILTMPEQSDNAEHIDSELLIANLLKQESFPLSADKVRCIHTGRAAGIQGVDLALRYLYEADEDYVLLGGSDSYLSYTRLDSLDSERLNTPANMDTFVPGEGAGFILLTRNPNQALMRDEHIIAISQPGIAEEPGHLFSDEPYLGDGLDKAFKQALKDYTGPAIETVYSSMNGEQHWAKENGVAMMRNHVCFNEQVTTEHPADCFGDLGAATGSVLMGLASLRLLNQSNHAVNLVYSSSDSAWRTAVLIHKVSQS